MTVVSFSRARFTPQDLTAFNEIAKPRIERGLWDGRIARFSTPDRDSLIIKFPHSDQPVFRFERDADGLYSLMFQSRKDWAIIGQGVTAEKCLGIWKHPVRICSVLEREPALAVNPDGAA